MGPRVAVLSLVTLALAASASAQLSDKQAVMQVKSASEAQLKVFKQSAKASLASLDATLDVFEDQFGPTSDAGTVAAQVGSALLQQLGALDDAFDTALTFPPAAASLALDAIADGGNLLGVYPEDFYFGAGGVLDMHVVKLRKAAAGVRASLLGRVAKTAKLAEKRGPIALLVEIRFPAEESAVSLNQGSLVSLGRGPRLDLLLSASRLDESGDGTLVVSGFTDGTLDDVNVDWLRTLGESGDADVSPDPASGRFAAVFDDNGAGLLEGGYAVSVREPGGLAHSTLSIGVR